MQFFKKLLFTLLLAGCFITDSLAIQQKNFQPLPICAFEHVLSGETTLEEVFRIANEIEDVRHKQNIHSNTNTVDTSRISL